jgi:hypothetical protein
MWVAAALRQAELGALVAEITREYRVAFWLRQRITVIES